MISLFRPACLALGLAVTAGPACAQTWIYESDYGAPVYRPRVVYQERYVPRAYNAYAYEPVVTATTQRTVVSRTIIPQGRGRAPIVKERIVTETAAPVYRPRVVTRAAVVDAYAYAPAPRVVTRPVVYDYPRAEAYGAYAYAPAPRVVTRPVVYDYPRAEAYGAYAYAPVARPVVTTVPVAVVPAYRYVNPLAVDPVTGVFLTDQ